MRSRRRARSVKLARLAISTSAALRTAKLNLEADIYSRSSRESRGVRVSTMMVLGHDLGPEGLLTLRVYKLVGIAAALKAGGYRSAPCYLLLGEATACETRIRLVT